MCSISIAEKTHVGVSNVESKVYSPVRKRRKVALPQRKFQPRQETAQRSAPTAEEQESMENVLKRIDEQIKKVLPNFDEGTPTSPRGKNAKSTDSAMRDRMLNEITRYFVLHG